MILWIWTHISIAKKVFHNLLNFTSQGRRRLHRAISMSSKQLMIRGNLLYIPLLKITGVRKNIHQALFQDTRIKIEIGIKMIYALTLHYWSGKVQACIFLILSKFIVDTFESSLYIRGIGNDKEIYKCTISIRLFKVGLVVVVLWFSLNYTLQMWNCNYPGF